MNSLIEELKQDHRKITNMLNELKNYGIASNKGIDVLMQSKKALLEHLEKEDNLLYPKLNKKAESDIFLRTTLDTFGQEMEKVSDFILDFYRKYSKNKINKSDFPKDISIFITALKGRIMKEEIGIYKAYEKLETE